MAREPSALERNQEQILFTDSTAEIKRKLINVPGLLEANIALAAKKNLKPTLVSLEGGIAVGKSSLLSALDNLIQYILPSGHVYHEITKEWELKKPEFNDDSVLEATYKNPKQFTYNLQSTVVTSSLSRALAIEKLFAENRNIKWAIQDRSFGGARDVFVTQNSRFLNPKLFEVLDRVTEVLKDTFESEQLKIGLVAPLEVGWNRVHQRGRLAEACMKKDYYVSNWALHQSYVWNNCHYVINVPDIKVTPAYLACIVAILIGYYNAHKPLKLNNSDISDKFQLNLFPEWVQRTHVPFPYEYLENLQ